MTQSRRLDAGVTNARTTARDDRDIFRLAPSMDATVLETIAARLEFRGTDEGYARRSQAYLPRLPLAHARRILALGCGTGIEVRALRRLYPARHRHHRRRPQSGPDRRRPTAHHR